MAWQEFGEERKFGNTSSMKGSLHKEFLSDLISGMVFSQNLRLDNTSYPGSSINAIKRKWPGRLVKVMQKKILILFVRKEVGLG